MLQKTYPQDYSCIVQPQEDVGGLYIFDLQPAQNIKTLQKHSIKAVITVAKGIDLNHSKQLIPCMLYVPADGHQDFNISTYFDKAADFISSALEKTNIMVHCLAGVSRSVSLVLSYFIKHQSFTYQQANSEEVTQEFTKEALLYKLDDKSRDRNIEQIQKP